MDEIKIIIEEFLGEQEIKLDKECLSCEYYDDICPYCDGIGLIPTDTGKAILELIKRYK